MAVSDLIATAAKSMVGALPSFMFAAGLGETQINKLTALALNKILFAQGWMFAVEVDGIGGMGIDFFMKDITGAHTPSRRSLSGSGQMSITNQLP